jgi:hypothetical protein
MTTKERELASNLLELAEQCNRVAYELAGLSDEQIADRLEDVEAAMIRVTKWRPGGTPRSIRITRGRVDHDVDAAPKAVEQAEWAISRAFADLGLSPENHANDAPD